MSQFLKYVTKKMQGGGDIGSLPGVLSLSAIQTKIKLDKDIKNQKALNAQATLSQYTPKPGDQKRMNANKDAYRKEQGKFLNRLADNQHMQAAAKNLPGATEFALNVMTAGEAGLALNTLAKPALKAAAKYATEKTALKNAYKINPYAFKPKSTAAYRMIGDERGYVDAVESGFLKPGKGSDIGKMHTETHFQMGVPSDKREYFGRTWSRGYDGPYMAEVSNAANDARFSSGPGGRLMGNNVWTYPENYIPTSQAKIYKQDWLKGYKEVPKQTGPPVSYYSDPVITRGPIANPWDGKGIRVEMEGSLDVPEGMMPYIGREEFVPTTPAEKVWASFFNGKARPIPPPYKKKKGGGPIVDSRGQWAHPGKITRIPGSDITMQGVNYPVYGVGSNGQKQMMYPGQDYNFGGASYVDEYPMMQLGGLSTGPIMPMINPIVSKIAEWFSGPSNKKSKSPKSLYQTQTEVSNKRYHDFLDKLDSNDDKNYDSSSRFVNLSAGRFKGAKVAPDMINDIVAAAKANNVDPWVMLSLVGRESTFGSGIESNKERANNKQQLLSGWDVAEDYMPYDFDRYLADKKVPGMNVYKSKQGYFYGTDDENIVEQYLQKHPELIEGYTKKLASTPDLGNMDSFNLAARRIKKKGIAKYNPGDPKYTYMVNQDMQLLKRDPELRAYMKSLGYQIGGSYPMMQDDDSIPVIEDAGSFNEEGVWVPDHATMAEQAKKLGARKVRTRNGSILFFDKNWNIVAADDNPSMQYGGQPVYDNLLSPASVRSKGIAAAKDKVTADKNAVAPIKNAAVNFMQGWMNSPMYKSMLQKSAGKESSALNASRKANLNTMSSGSGTWKLENLNPDNTFVDNYVYNDRLLGEFYFDKNKLSIDSHLDSDEQKRVGVHELSHATDKAILPAADVNKMQSYRKSFEKTRKGPVLVSDSFYHDYIAEPTETRARLNALRYQGKEQGIYDPFTEKFDKSKLNLFNSRFSKNAGLDQLRQIYTDDQIVDMLNSVSKNNTQQDMMYAEQGGEMIRRADGSYSRRGLWDNIRANKGSGKQPTKEMLEQERKIKTKEMKNGGTNNPGFDALPDYVQANILSNMGYGGMTYPFMQKGGEPNGEMALGQMSAVSDKMSKLLKFVRPDDNLDPWIASKLAVMDHSADAIADYMMYGPDAQQQEEEMGQMMASGGYVVTRSDDRKGKTHKVTGPDGSVKYFGDSKLGQHPNDPERKAAFYARHEKNLENNPHFRAFARKTWQDGGEYDMMANGGYIGQDGRRHISTTPTWSGNTGYKMGGGMPCYECGGMYAEGGMYDCDDQEKDPVTGKCAADVARGREANAANKAAAKDMNSWAKQVAAMDKEVAKQYAAQYAGQMSFDYDWMETPVEKAEKKAAMAQYKQFFQQNPKTFVADDTSGFSPEQKYIIASKLKQKASTPMGSKAFKQKFNQDPNFFDLGRLQSDIVPMMGGWNATRNYLFGNKKYGGPAVGAEMDVTPEQLEALRKQGYEFEII